jgi:TRAP-type mannitol/chloroaromatic compound transport system substrate-binding protein
MPAEEELPEPLKPLWRRNALELTVKHWDQDVAQLVRRLGEVPGLAAAGQAPSPPGTIPWKTIAAGLGVAAVSVGVGLWLWLSPSPGDPRQTVTKTEGGRAPVLRDTPAQSQKPAIPSTPETMKSPETKQPAAVTLRVQDTYATRYGYSRHLLELAKVSESLSKEGMKFDVLPAGAVVPAHATLDAVAKGTINLAWVAPGNFSTKSAAFALLDSPPFSPGPEEYLQWRGSTNVKPIVDKLYAGHGVHALPCGVIWLADLWTNAPVRTAGDLKGRKIIVSGALQSEIYRAAGAAPMRMPGGEVSSALHAGVANSIQMLDPAAGVTMGLHEFARALYYPARLAPAGGIDLLVNRDTWNSIGPQNRRALEEGCKRISRQMLESGRDAQKEAISKAALRGVVVEELPFDALDMLLGAWRKVASAKRDDEAFQRLYATLE